MYKSLNGNIRVIYLITKVQNLIMNNSVRNNEFGNISRMGMRNIYMFSNALYQLNVIYQKNDLSYF